MRHAILTVALLLAGASLLAAAPLVIVRDGLPRATIIVAASESTADRAAAELQKYIEKMSGARLPIVKEGAPANATVAILVGHTATAKKLGVKIPAGFNPAVRPEAFEEEGFVLKTTGNAIVVAGNADGPYQGTLYAAYALLERLGCRWYFPGAWGEVVPEAKTVAVPPLDVLARPDFSVRGIWMDGRWAPSAKDREEYAAWGARVGFGCERVYPAPGDGYLAVPLPPKEYAAAHPEFYAMNRQGAREVTPASPPWTTMLCLSNPAMLQEYLKNVREAFAGKRAASNVFAGGIGISPPDGQPVCFCPDCQAASQHFLYPTYFQEAMQSEELAGFAGKVADAFPDKWVTISAYALREMPPQGVAFRPNMGAMVAPISSCVLHPNDDPSCWRRQESQKILAQWRRRTPHVWLYDYTPGLLVSGFEPEADTANFAVNAPLYRKLGIKGFTRQGSNAMMATWISYYTCAKLMWNAHADVAALKKDFYDTFFGPAAGPHVQAWWDACEGALRGAKIHVHEEWLLNNVYTAAFAASIHRHVEAARAAAMTDKQRARFDAFALIAENFEASCRMEEAEKNLDYAGAAACAARMIAARNRLSDISPFLVNKRAQTVDAYGIYTKGRLNKYEKFAAMTDGRQGTLVAALPLVTKFARDRFNQGVIAAWYAPGFDDAAWGTKSTFYTWDAQDPPEDAAGHDYDGYGWYRATVEIPARFAGQPIHFTGGGAINEAWVWVNGRYAGHKPYAMWWMGNHDFDLDVTRLVRPGERNAIAIRVWNNADIGGLYRRGFFWSPAAKANP